VTIGVRPENLAIGTADLELEVDVVEELGADAYVYRRADVGGAPQPIVARVDWRSPPAKGEIVHVAPIDETAIHVFAAATGARIS
jgi:multiple sugar transport system ATP-binding protein